MITWHLESTKYYQSCDVELITQNEESSKVFLSKITPGRVIVQSSNSSSHLNVKLDFKFN